MEKYYKKIRKNSLNAESLTLNAKQGFTLMELLVVMGITAIIGTAVLMNLPGLKAKNTLDFTTNELIGYLREAQQKAISQDQGSRWGIHLEATDGDRDFYEIFYGDSYSAGTVTLKIVLPPVVEFSSPAQGNIEDVIFYKATGAPTADHVIVLALARDSAVSRAITVLAGTGLIDVLTATPSFNFAVSVTPNSETVAPGSGAEATVDLTLLSGASQLASFSIERLPEGVNVTFTPEGCNPTCSSTMDITTSPTTPGESYVLIISASSAEVLKTTNYTLIVSAPEAPTAPQNLTATGGAGQVELNWETPADDGGSAITDYNIYRGETSGGQGETPIATIDDLLRTYIDTDVDGGTTYYYKVSAVNGVGEGPQSDEVSAMALGSWNRVFVTSTAYMGGDLLGLSGADSKCQGLADTAGLGGTWKAWLSDGSTSALSRLNHSTDPYKLINGTTIANNWTDLTDGNLAALINADEYGNQILFAPSTTWTNTNTDGTIFISLSNYTCADWTDSTFPKEGRGGYWTSTDSLWTNAGSAPGFCVVSSRLYCFEQPAGSVPTAPTAPQNLTAAGGFSQVELNWLAPADDGGSAITDYNIYRGETSGGQGETPIATIDDLLRTYIDTDVMDATTYYYKVSAVNSAGESSLSNEASATTDFRVFITSTAYKGNLGGLLGADSKCQGRADAVGLGGTWKAWLSDGSTSASSRLFHASVPYTLLDATTIANDWADLTDGNLADWINVNENGGSSNTRVWTNTTISGEIASANHCSNWTADSGFGTGRIGNSFELGSTWTNWSTSLCAYSSYNLYCFEQ